MDLSIEDEDTPPSFFKRRSTWMFAFVGLVAVGLAGWWFKVDAAKKTTSDLVAAGKYDAAWAMLNANRTWFGDCDRYGIMASLAQADERNDTLVLKMADSVRACKVPPDSILQLVALGNLRISDHLATLDSSARWSMQTNAFTAASECVKSDSGNKACRAFGFRALVGMKDSYAQVNWMISALARWPKDSAFLVMAEEAKRANDAVKLAAAQPAAPIASDAAKVAPKKAAKKKHK